MKNFVKLIIGLCVSSLLAWSPLGFSEDSHVKNQLNVSKKLMDHRKSVVKKTYNNAVNTNQVGGGHVKNQLQTEQKLMKHRKSVVKKIVNSNSKAADSKY